MFEQVAPLRAATCGAPNGAHRSATGNVWGVALAAIAQIRLMLPRSSLRSGSCSFVLSSREWRASGAVPGHPRAALERLPNGTQAAQERHNAGE